MRWRYPYGKQTQIYISYTFDGFIICYFWRKYYSIPLTTICAIGYSNYGDNDFWTAEPFFME
jgi:hypothetical protein